LSQTPDITRGLAGFTRDNRPLYASIDPTRAGCDAVFVGTFPEPRWNNVATACYARGSSDRDDELQLLNGDGYDSHIASFMLSKAFDGGVFTEGGSTFFSFGYAFTAANDRRNMYNSTAGSNFDNLAAFDRQDPQESRGFFSSKHNFSTQLNFNEQFFGDMATRLGITFIARSGRPYSLTFTGGSGVFNDAASGFDNALLYLPTGVSDPNVAPSSNMAAVQRLVDFASGLGCAKKYLGQTIPRNTCSNDWYYDLDLSLSQEIPGPGSFFGLEDRLKLFATFDNFLNFLDDDWNVQRRRNFAGLQDISTVTGVDAQGRYIFGAADNLTALASGLTGYEEDNQINVSSSVWRLKIGISYEF
jgi:hypothetical protein